MIQASERGTPQRIGIVLALYAIAFTTPVLYRAGPRAARSLNLSPTLQSGIGYGIYAAIAVLIWIAIHRRHAGISIAPIAAPQRHGIAASICDPLLVVVAIAAVFIIALVVGPFGKDFVIEPSSTATHRVILGIGASIIAPVAEEVSGRWLLYRGLRPPEANGLIGFSRARAVAPALLASSIAFGLYHYLVAGPTRMAVTAIIGLILAASYEASGKLWVPIAVHIFINTRASLITEFDTTYGLDVIAILALSIPAATTLIRTRPRMT